MGKSLVGVVGLGVMGRSLSLNIAEKGHSLSVYNRAIENEESYVQDFLNLVEKDMEVEGFTNLNKFVLSLEHPRKILLMINAGNAIDQVIEQLIPILSEGDIIIDGGNSHYQDTKRRVAYLESRKFNFIGVGISGGEEGARKGPSIMPGGDRSCYKIVGPILESIAARDENGSECCAYIGPEGAGHFVKMVHNGIEYVEMQLLAEMYALLSISKSNKEISELFLEWNAGSLSSYLLEITADILTKKEGDQYVLDLIVDKAGNKGTGSWSSKAALELGSVNSMMSSAVFARYVSFFKEKRRDLSKKVSTVVVRDLKISNDELKQAYIYARIINHRQGFELIRQASESYRWKISLSELSRIWTNGCIIRSELMNSCVSYFQDCDDLFEHSKIIEVLNNHEKSAANVIMCGLSNRVAMGAFSEAHTHWISMTTERLPANLIQAQRDYFGAHTYQRIDSPENEYFHHNWY